LELTFRTQAGYSAGGALASLSWASSPTTTSSYARDLLYMTSNGRLGWGEWNLPLRLDPWVNPTTERAAALTAGSYNDGRWHHVVATFGPGSGLKIYVDGVLAANDPAKDHSATFAGRLRIGGDSLTGWPGAPGGSFFAGTIDEFAKYPYPLTPLQVARHKAALLP
jgi:hypothetical protein